MPERDNFDVLTNMRPTFESRDPYVALSGVVRRGEQRRHRKTTIKAAGSFAAVLLFAAATPGVMRADFSLVGITKHRTTPAAERGDTTTSIATKSKNGKSNDGKNTDAYSDSNSGQGDSGNAIAKDGSTNNDVVTPVVIGGGGDNDETPGADTGGNVHTVALRPTLDTSVNSTHREQSFANDSELLFSNSNGRAAYVKFDLSSIHGNITNAKLYFYEDRKSDLIGNGTAPRVFYSGDFNASTTYKTAPSFGAQICAIDSYESATDSWAVYKKSWFSFTITSAVASSAGSELNLGLKGGTADEFHSPSSETTLQVKGPGPLSDQTISAGPQLIVTYTD